MKFALSRVKAAPQARQFVSYMLQFVIGNNISIESISYDVMVGLVVRFSESQTLGLAFSAIDFASCSYGVISDL